MFVDVLTDGGDVVTGTAAFWAGDAEPSFSSVSPNSAGEAKANGSFSGPTHLQAGVLPLRFFFFTQKHVFHLETFDL